MKALGLLGVVGLLATVGRGAEDRPVPPGQAAARMTVPDGFHVGLFAGEPDVVQPIALTIDPRGRLWVAECLSYPQWVQTPEGHDRIVILEDADGDGRFDKRTVFADKIANLSGLELGFGGVWACATPNLLFIPDRNGDDVADGPPTIVLDGWDRKAQHNVFNALRWGPDGWLYGCNGILSNSVVGAPGTPDSDRVKMNCGVWRYHPTRKQFEAVAHGTTNPWGLDFDDYGEMFITNCVIPHLFHVPLGAHFQRMFGQDINPHSYGLLESCADHIHWAGGHWTDSRGGKGKHDEAGGGHAHAGAMIYLGDNWPDRYRNSLCTCNIHGHRVNRDTLDREGAGYVARHAKDFLMANDDWFRGLELKSGPDGSVFLTDWSDTGECHENDADGAHRENGRIYKITYGKVAPMTVDLDKVDAVGLAALQTHKNEWHVRTARRLLQERAAAGDDLGAARDRLNALFRDTAEETRKLRVLWALFAIGACAEPALLDMTADPSAAVRGWALRLIGEGKAPSDAALQRFATLARTDPSPRVRLQLASVLQRIPLAHRWPIAEALAAHQEDAADPELPLMLWYAIEPLPPADRTRAVALLAGAKLPLVRQYTARRIVAGSNDLTDLAQVLFDATDPLVQRDVLRGIHEALRGRKDVARPARWDEVFQRIGSSPDPDVRAEARIVALLLDDPKGPALLSATALDPALETSERQGALQALIDVRAPVLFAVARRLIDDRALRGPALRALAACSDEAVPATVLNGYAKLTDAERDDAVATLASRPSWARALLDALEQGTVPRRDLSVFLARQLQAYNDPQINARLAKVWGTVRPTSGAKAALVTKYKALLTPERMQTADPARGRLVFTRTCQQCHTLFTEGNMVGPELTGSDRANLDYVLENVLDPSAAVGQDYKLVTVATRDGRLLSGIVREKTENGLTLQTANDRIVLATEDVEAMKPSNTSMMPEGLFEKLSDDEVRDLVAYLASKAQVALPPP